MEPKDKQQAQAYVDDIFEIIPKGSFGLVDFEKARCVYADEEHMREIIIDQMTNYLVKVGFIGKKNPLLWEKMTILVYNNELGHKGLFLTNKKASHQERVGMPDALLEGTAPYVGITCNDNEWLFRMSTGNGITKECIQSESEMNHDETLLINNLAYYTKCFMSNEDISFPRGEL